MTIPSFFSSKNAWFAVAIGISILLIGLFLMHHVPIQKKDIAATGFLFDMVITFPVIWYFLVIRPLKLRKWRIVFVFTLCCVVAYLILPTHQKSYIIQIRKLTFVAELGMIVYMAIKARKIRTEYKRLQAAFPDIAYNLYKSMVTILGNGAYVKIIASELTILRFGLLCWKKQAAAPEGTVPYTTYKESNYPVLFGVILFSCIIEITALHLVLLHYSKIAALIVSIISLYGTIFIVSDLSAILKSPVLILDDRLLLRTGMRWRAMVNKTNIASIEKIKDSFQPVSDCFKGAALKNSANVLITFKHPVQIERIYRKSISANTIVMGIDQADDFLTELKN
jgi:hypothetical protein